MDIKKQFTADSIKAIKAIYKACVLAKQGSYLISNLWLYQAMDFLKDMMKKNTAAAERSSGLEKVSESPEEYTAASLYVALVSSDVFNTKIPNISAVIQGRMNDINQYPPPPITENTKYTFCVKHLPDADNKSKFPYSCPCEECNTDSVAVS